jgi:glycosyltransferase involved in cell wall biosynthesis
MANPLVPGAFVSWVPFHGRSQGISDALNLMPIYASYFGIERPALAPIKYGPQAFRTLRALSRLRPGLVFVMDPPVFAVLAVALYCRRHGARYVMDCHHGVFRSSRWRWSLPLQRLLGTRAAAVMVTNPVHLQAVNAWPARGVIMADAPPRLAPPSSRQRPIENGRDVFVVLRFGPDEAVAEILQAARQLPQVRFHLSGDVRRAAPEWLRQHPPNVHFTGFLPLEEFWSRLRGANVILTLTSEDDAILRGGWEAMFAGQPLITSGTRALRNYFSRGTVFVDNVPDAIAAGIQTALAHQEELRQDMELLRMEQEATWAQERRELERILGVDLSATRDAGPGLLAASG